VEVLAHDLIEHLPGFATRTRWFLQHRTDLARHISYMEHDATSPGEAHGHLLLAIPSKDRLTRVLAYMLDEREFLSAFGVRSLSRVHAKQPYVFPVNGADYRVEYEPGESKTEMFGGNSNWRGPVWFPVNFLIIEALERFHRFYGEEFTVECPTGSSRRLTLQQVAQEIRSRLATLFLPDDAGRRPCHGGEQRFASDPAWRNLVLFHEYFHGETGCGLGANHQTGWTALVTECLRSADGAGNAVMNEAVAATQKRSSATAGQTDGTKTAAPR